MGGASPELSTFGFFPFKIPFFPQEISLLQTNIFRFFQISGFIPDGEGYLSHPIWPVGDLLFAKTPGQGWHTGQFLWGDKVSSYKWYSFLMTKCKQITGRAIVDHEEVT